MEEKQDGRLILNVYPSYFYEENQLTTLIKLNDDITDTLICTFDLSNGNEILENGWLNGKELTGRFIQVAFPEIVET
ncbi:MAG: hypothetical protein AAGA77_15300 [Bacteroidota bacterium]